MELMSTCLDKLLKRTRLPIPEKILGKMAVAVSEPEFVVVFNFIVLIVSILKKIICRLMEKMKCKLNFEIV